MGRLKAHFGARLFGFGAFASCSPQESMERAPDVDGFFVGEPTKRQREFYTAIHEIFMRTRDAVKPGIAIEDIDAVAERTTVELGFGDYIWHRTGHALGVDVHELPSVAKGDKTVLEPGMAFTIEPGIYDFSVGAFRIEDVVVVTPTGLVPAVLAPRAGYTMSKESQPDIKQLALYFGTSSAAETEALGVAVGQSATVRKKFMPLGSQRATGRSMDDRNGSAALLLALAQIDPATVENQVTFAWSIEEETGLTGAQHLASRLKPDTAFAVDTFVSTDTPVDIQRLAGAKLGHGAVLRILDSRTIVSPATVDRIIGIARDAKIPLQLGTTSGGTDASAFSAGGAIDVGLSWPGRYSHSPVEIMDKRDLDALVRLIVALARNY